MFSSDRRKLRQVYIDAWQAYQQGQILSPLQKQIVSIIEQHPEYHSILNYSGSAEQNFNDHNPFLHLSLHLSLIEQISTDRPAGIRLIYQRLCRQLATNHAAEHCMIDCLSQILWQAEHQPPDEQAYLSCLKKILK